MFKLKGKVVKSEGRYITFHFEDITEPLPKEDLKVTIDKWHPPRSLNANGYYWKLCNLLADKLSEQGTTTTTARIHNLHLRSIWQTLVKKIDGTPVMDIYPDTDAAEQMILEDMNKHLVPVPSRWVDTFENSKGKKFRYYFELRGSSEMDSKEFSRLVDMVVQECKDQGIKTLDDYEMERLEGYERRD